MMGALWHGIGTFSCALSVEAIVVVIRLFTPRAVPTGHERLKIAYQGCQVFWWTIFLISAANISLAIRFPHVVYFSDWPTIVGMIGVVWSAIRLGQLPREYRRLKTLQVFE